MAGCRGRERYPQSFSLRLGGDSIFFVLNPVAYENSENDEGLTLQLPGSSTFSFGRLRKSARRRKCERADDFLSEWRIAKGRSSSLEQVSN